MKIFRVFMVDDDPHWVEAIERLLTRYKDALMPSTDMRIEVTVAVHQRDADEKLRAATAGFDLVLLDIKYPPDADKPDDYLGHLWLPTLRDALPHAAIVIYTSYGTEKGMQLAVNTLLSGDADEFIPKEVKWAEMLPRLQAAMKHRHSSRQLAAATNPLLSNVARTSAEDIKCSLSRARASVRRLSAHADPSGGLSPEDVSDVIETLQAEIDAITTRLSGRMDATPQPVSCLDLVGEQALVFEAQIKTTIPVTFSGDTDVLTYPEDLRIAVREVFQNAVDAIVEATAERKKTVAARADRQTGAVATDDVEPEPSAQLVSVHVSRVAELHAVRIEIRDSGPGFADAALDKKFQPGASFWTRDKDRHRGMGLYVARRMMYSIGGDLEIHPTDRDGTVATLLVRDWSSR